MKKVYKLTDRDGRTHGGFRWVKGKRYTIPRADRGGRLCTKSWFHWYTDPRLAVLMNPAHANIADPVLWEADARGDMANDRGLKGGSTTLALRRLVPLPAITTTERVAFGILVVWPFCTDTTWREWADGWLSGMDRSLAAADYAAAYAAAAAAARAADAARAAAAAADAARAAAARAAAAADSDWQFHLLSCAYACQAWRE